MIKKLISISLVIIISTAGYFYLTRQDSGEATLDKVVQKKNKLGLQKDVTKEIGVNNSNDVKYSQNKDDLKIVYGNFTMEFKKANLLKEDINKKLGIVGLKVDVKSNGDLRLYYKGEEVIEYKN